MDNDKYNLSPVLLFNGTCLMHDSPTPEPDNFARTPLPMGKERTSKSREHKTHKRSSLACSGCRARKVRCNVVVHGAPCSNCTHDQVDCVVPLSRRQLRQRLMREKTEESTRKSQNASTVREQLHASVQVEDRMSKHCCSDDGSQSLQNPEFQHSDAARGHHTWERSQSDGSNVYEKVLPEVLSPMSLESFHSREHKSKPSASRTTPWTQILPPLASAIKYSNSSSKNLDVKNTPHHSKIFTPFPEHLDDSDIAYLTLRDALTIPSEQLQVKLLEAYVEFVNGTIPLLDLEEFLSIVKYGDEDGESGREIHENGNRKISLLLFQAVMFAGAEFISMKSLKEDGYQTRHSAQRIFFNRIRLLYDFDTCTDRLSVIQSLLLMTLYPSPSFSPCKDGKDSWHWLGLAISLSIRLGLNQDTPKSSSTSRKKKLERRIWWTAFVLDTTLALGDSKSSRIRKEDCNINLLSVEDFDLDFENDDSGSRRRRVDAILYVEKAMLCWYSNDLFVLGHANSCRPVLNSNPLSQPPFADRYISHGGCYREDHGVNQTSSGCFDSPIFSNWEETESEWYVSTLAVSSDDCIPPEEVGFLEGTPSIEPLSPFNSM